MDKSIIQPYRWILKRLSVAARHHGLGGGALRPSPNKNTIEPNRDVARRNRENVPPIPGKLEN